MMVHTHNLQNSYRIMANYAYLVLLMSLIMVLALDKCVLSAIVGKGFTTMSEEMKSSLLALGAINHFPYGTSSVESWLRVCSHLNAISSSHKNGWASA